MSESKERVWSFQNPLQGTTLGSSLSLSTNNAVVVSAAGGEFRVVFSQGEAETRGSSCVCICFVIGQHNNNRASVGFANPGLPPFLYTREHPDATVSRDLAQAREWWFGIDKETGWAFCGVGGVLGQRILLCAPFPRIDWTHISFSNWIEPVSLNVKTLGSLPVMHSNNKKFSKFCSVIRFEGVTCVSPIRLGQPLAEVMCMIQTLIRENPRLAPHYGLLPPSSFHVTTFDLLNCTSAEYDQNAAGFDASFVKLREAFTQARKLLPSSLTFLPTGMNNRSEVMLLDPDAKTAEALRKWREALGQKAGVESHQDYEFHTTLMYQLYPINSAEAQASFRSVLVAANALVRTLGLVTIPASAFCQFKDMGAFPPA